MGFETGLDGRGKSRLPPGFYPRIFQAVANVYAGYEFWVVLDFYAVLEA